MIFNIKIIKKGYIDTINTKCKPLMVNRIIIHLI
jgi:hypothetical protein